MNLHIHPHLSPGGGFVRPARGANKLMKTTLQLMLIASATFCVPMKTKAQPVSSRLTSATFNWKSTRSGELKYLLYLPAEYKADSQQRWPLMLFLHGAGERGSDLQRVAVHGPLKLVKKGKSFPFIIVAPQCPEDQIWENESLLQLLEAMEQQYSVDARRVYLTGLSMGGYGTWKLGLTNPERFAALVPICGGGNMIDALLVPRAREVEIKRIPIWAFHGGKDDVVPLSESQRMVDQLRRIGGKEVKLTVYAEARHDSWTETYDSPELYEWLLKQSR
jgi:predicted peptidase